jgi:uncharacterized membrane protein
MEELKRALRKLPHEEYEEAIGYYEEYLDDAEDQEKAIKKLGSPKQVAAKIFADYASKPTNKVSALTVFLIICSFPFLLPIGIALLALLFALVVAIAALYNSFFALILSGIVGLVASFALIATSPLTTLFFVGFGLFSFALGYFVIRGLIALTRVMFDSLSKLGVKTLRRFAK